MNNELPRKTEKPWGYELLFALTPQYAGKILFVKKGHRLSLQYHNEKDETLYIQEGKALLEIEDENGNMVKTEASAGTSFRLPSLKKHRFQAIEDTTFLEVSTPELDDVVRLDDDYGRSGNTA
jgi:mannose-6-phosphate isomerase